MIINIVLIILLGIIIIINLKNIECFDNSSIINLENDIKLTLMPELINAVNQVKLDMTGAKRNAILKKLKQREINKNPHSDKDKVHSFAHSAGVAQQLPKNNN